MTFCTKLYTVHRVFVHVFAKMANQSSSSSWSYHDTIYSSVISKLVCLGKNPKSIPVLCPKQDCQFKLYLTQQLYRHIENNHPEDKLHSRTYSKYSLLFYIFQLK